MTGGGRREATKARNRAAILTAAVDAFTEVGYGATTVREITRRTGHGVGTFYNYFPDKKAVLREVLDEAASAVRSRVHAARSGAGTLEEFVAGAYRAVFEALAERRAVFEMVLRNLGSVRELTEQDVVAAAFAELREDLVTAMEAGTVPAADVEYLTAVLGSMTLDLAVRMFARDPVDVDGAARFATAFALGGIRTVSSTAPREAAARVTRVSGGSGAARPRP